MCLLHVTMRLDAAVDAVQPIIAVFSFTPQHHRSFSPPLSQVSQYPPRQRTRSQLQGTAAVLTRWHRVLDDIARSGCPCGQGHSELECEMWRWVGCDV
jgi:hypothetical protein